MSELSADKAIDYKSCLPTNFDVTTLSRGDDYFQLKKVMRFSVDDDGLFLDGMVRGSSLRKYYFVEVTIKKQANSRNPAVVSSSCTCLVGRQCKHAVAVLLAARAKLNDSRRELLQQNSLQRSSLFEPDDSGQQVQDLAVSEQDIDWYSEVTAEERDYFRFKIGVLIDGKKVNLLPLIAEILRTHTAKEIASKADSDIATLRMPDGRRLLLSYQRLKPMLLNLLEVYHNNLEQDGGLLMIRSQALILAELQKAFAASKMRWFGGEKILDLGKRLNNFDTIPERLPPANFRTVLRHYQQEGVNWLQFLREYELGGILADDMGLGKTVQTLAHLAIEYADNRLDGPVLIVAPTSLMTNWRLEIERFVPHFGVIVFHGDDRHRNLSKVHAADIVLTTYPLLIRDKHYLLQQQFSWLILDEAQAIKNHKAKSTLVVQQLQAKHRLCLTGTPMENHLGELWSLFHFLTPGYLGDQRYFRKQFKTPIERHSDEGRRHALALRVKPFLLRRLKVDVLKELPAKTEILQAVTLEGKQRDLYESIRLLMEEKVRQAIADQGLGRSQIIILDALLKLRQVCCDPRLLKLATASVAHGHSAKLSLLMELLPNMLEEGRRVLLFSQFTSMLSLIEIELAKQDIKYVKLTGRTKDRATPIAAFQAGKVPLFLISLKAGGTGLNLTAADTVIHYDPWWNPAVEDQATDRAHRIGQDKSVFVYKLIAEGTVEETISKMQADKRNLLQQVVGNEQAGQFNLTADDLQVLFTEPL